MRAIQDAPEVGYAQALSHRMNGFPLFNWMQGT